MPERQKVTLGQIATKASVSTATVSRALSGTLSGVEPETRERIVAIAREMGYTDKSLSSVAIYLPRRYFDEERPHFFISQVVRSVTRAVGKYNAIVNLVGGDDLESKRFDQLRGNLLGVLIIPNGKITADPLANALTPDEQTIIGMGIPTVIVGTVTKLPENAGRVLVVDVDNRTAAHLATQHLLDLGHRRIAHLAGPKGRLGSEERRRGYLHAMTEYLLRSSQNESDDTAAMTEDMVPIPKGYIVEAIDWQENRGYEAMKTLLSWPNPTGGLRNDCPTAVVCATDALAAGGLRAIREFGLHVPDDISLVGHDNSEHAEPNKLTTVDFQLSMLGREALSMLSILQGLGPDDGPFPARRLQPLLVKRESTAPPRQ